MCGTTTEKKVRSIVSNDNIVVLRRQRSRGDVLSDPPGHREERQPDTDGGPGLGVCEDSNDAPGGEGKECVFEESLNLSSLTTVSMKRRSKADICSVGWDSDTVQIQIQRQISHDVLKKQSQTDTEDTTFGDISRSEGERELCSMVKFTSRDSIL